MPKIGKGIWCSSSVDNLLKNFKESNLREKDDDMKVCPECKIKMEFDCISASWKCPDCNYELRAED